MDMEKKLTPKQEAFAQAIASGKSQSDAYRMAFKVRPNTKPESVNQSASKLMANPNISSRVGVLRQPIVEKVRVTLEGHLLCLADIRDKAIAEGKLAPAVQAEIARGKASGLYVERIGDPEGKPMQPSAPVINLTLAK